MAPVRPENTKKKGAPKGRPSSVNNNPPGVVVGGDGTTVPAPPPTGDGATTGLARDQISGEGMHGGSPSLSNQQQEASGSTAGQNNDQAARQGDPSQPQAQDAESRLAAQTGGTQMDLDEQTKSAEQAFPAGDHSQQEAIYAEWVAAGKPACTSCGSKHPPPCDPSIKQERDRMAALKLSDPTQWKIENKQFQAQRRALKDQRRREELEIKKRNERAQQGGADSEMVDRPSNPPSDPSKSTRAQAKNNHRGRPFRLPWCESCQAYHQFGKHMLTKEQAQHLKNLQAQGKVAKPDRSLVEKNFQAQMKPAEAKPQGKAEAAAAAAAELNARKDAVDKTVGEQLPQIFGQMNDYNQMLFLASYLHGNAMPAIERTERAAFGNVVPQPQQQKTYADMARPTGSIHEYAVATAPQPKANAEKKRGNKTSNKTRGNNSNNSSSSNNNNAGNGAQAETADGQPKPNFRKGQKYALHSQGPLPEQEQPAAVMSGGLSAPHRGTESGECPQ